ncbi:MAG: hypothetical protein AB7T31_12720 [Gemmatimonadales bacterium]
MAERIVLRMATGVPVLHAGYARPYAAIGAAIVGLAFLRLGWPDDIWILGLGTIAAMLVVGWEARSSLSIADTFPDLTRWAPLKRITG